MIQSFAHKGLRQFFFRGSKGGIRPADAAKLQEILARLETANTVDDMALPGFRLHPLRGNLSGFWSVSVNGPWRIIFRFEDGHAWEVNYVQYH
jgi:proteic killer suppression protein